MECFAPMINVRCVAVGGAMTKSMSVPCHMTTLPPDPFPELSQHKMRLYRFQEVDSDGDLSGTLEPRHSSPDAMTRSADLVTETPSMKDDLTQVCDDSLLILGATLHLFLSCFCVDSTQL